MLTSWKGQNIIHTHWTWKFRTCGRKWCLGITAPYSTTQRGYEITWLFIILLWKNWVTSVATNHFYSQSAYKHVAHIPYMKKRQILKCPERITKYYLWDTTKERVWCIPTKLPQPLEQITPWLIPKENSVRLIWEKRKNFHEINTKNKSWPEISGFQKGTY